MPNIRHLSLEPWGDLFDTLDCLNLPGLTSVRLQGNNMDYLYLKPTEVTNRRFRSFFDRTPGSKVVSLSLDTVPISDEVIISLLRMVPTLEQLDIAEKYHREYKSISTYFWKSLSIVRPTSSHIVVPRLKELNLTFYGKDLDDDALLDTLTSRFDPGGDVAPLKIITLNIVGTVSKKLEESLGYLKTYSGSKGTRLSVECFKRQTRS
ncbi:hypothetical protein VNI00_014374 [Paramarasmius palmivorus]|uniref:Uncharacterized protein n=1 Tax=Paramarasmius palmivorus TaxID=297713 RepID=A0AAW0BTP3_9AGAR